MSTENENPNAQGTQPGAPASADQNPASQPGLSEQQFAGIQKRFDEFTARLNDERREKEALQAQNQQLLTALTQRQADPYPQQVQQPQVEIDPALKQQFEAMLAPITQQYQRQLAQVTGMATDGALGALIATDVPAVQARARQLWAQVVANGDHLRGWTPQQAAVIARGEILPTLLTAQQSQQVQNAQRAGAWNAQPGALPGNPTVPTTAPAAAVAEPDIDEDPEAASAYYAKKLGGKTF